MLNEAPHFGEDYFFKDEAIGTAAATSGVFNLGQTLGNLRVRAWVEGTVAVASGSALKVELQTADTPASTAWTKIAENTLTATDTTPFSGELFNYIPDTDAPYMRVVVTPSAATGKISAAPELV